jgi:ribose 5-phosphate isomerase A
MSTAADVALQMVLGVSRLGLGTGRAATAFVYKLGVAVHHGRWTGVGVPTSEQTAQLAHDLGIPLSTLNETPELDICVDGADEVDAQGRLIKGWGGALLREKVVAAASGRLIILAGAEKLVPKLGSRGKLPVEVVPFAAPLCRRRIQALGFESVIRGGESTPFVTDNGNWILDLAVSGLASPEKLEEALDRIPGVVETGLFLGMASNAVIEHADRVETMTFPRDSG